MVVLVVLLLLLLLLLLFARAAAAGARAGARTGARARAGARTGARARRAAWFHNCLSPRLLAHAFFFFNVLMIRDDQSVRFFLYTNKTDESVCITK